MEELTPTMKRLAKAFSILKQLVARKFFGKVTLYFEAGNVVNIHVSESFKVE
jgi:hypothetical protein